MNRATRYSPEVRERAVRMLFEHQSEYESQWSAMASIASKIGCTTETLRKWVISTPNRRSRRPVSAYRKPVFQSAFRVDRFALDEILAQRAKDRFAAPGL